MANLYQKCSNLTALELGYCHVCGECKIIADIDKENCFLLSNLTLLVHSVFVNCCDCEPAVLQELLTGCTSLKHFNYLAKYSSLICQSSFVINNNFEAALFEEPNYDVEFVATHG